MNPLAHTQFNLKLLKEFNIKGNHNLVLIGGILPDIAELGLINIKEAHTDSLGFIDYLSNSDPEMVPLGFGFMLHGEDPQGLDYYTHKRNGFIDQNMSLIAPIVHSHKPFLPPHRVKFFTHSVMEFAIDSFLDNGEADAVNHAVRSEDLGRIAFHLEKYFNGDGHRILKTLKYFRKFDFNKLNNTKSVARYWKGYMFLHNFANNNFLKRYLFFGQTSALIRKKTIVAMLEESSEVLRPIYEQFYSHVYEKMAASFFRPFGADMLLPEVVKQKKCALYLQH